GGGGGGGTTNCGAERRGRPTTGALPYRPAPDADCAAGAPAVCAPPGAPAADGGTALGPEAADANGARAAFIAPEAAPLAGPEPRSGGSSAVGAPTSSQSPGSWVCAKAASVRPADGARRARARTSSSSPASRAARNRGRWERGAHA